MCSCLTPQDSCDSCEVDCLTDCNDLKSQDGKCYSENACRPSLLFEENCRNEEVVTVLPICQLKKGAVVDLLFNEENCQQEIIDIEH